MRKTLLTVLHVVLVTAALLIITVGPLFLIEEPKKDIAIHYR